MWKAIIYSLVFLIISADKTRLHYWITSVLQQMIIQHSSAIFGMGWPNHDLRMSDYGQICRYIYFSDPNFNETSPLQSSDIYR